MKPIERQTRSRLMSLFREHGFGPNARLGQNFLIDINIIDFVVREADITPDDVVLEVGVGTGGMTSFLAYLAAHVVAVEIDPNMYRLASDVLANADNLSLLNIDALRNKNHFADEVVAEVDKALAVDESRRLKLVANLPYSVGTPVMSNLLATDWPWERMVTTIQLELAERMIAGPRTSDYSALSVWMQSQCRVEILRKLPPSVFWPQPKVNSAIVRVVPDHDAMAKISDREFFQDFLRRLFTLRRKLMAGVLAGMYRKTLSKDDVRSMLEDMNLPTNVRAEQLEPAQLVELSNRLHAITQSNP
ncbi:16S rRNA (adenine(1518)-N(6)/adenine(1519)-N(6))-dimethyltransferase RsmA [Thalassoroseus pseudoceratinae]|uniref:16S rRNA (adenine(1518)-N(6)/adenine(1519)-N(6))- dimethyltransferase RsmA n=1 Tax=Thalassoroseus pseudoceratinae TaxID=2713176 RepID=UPI0014219333|nr:16S rRNA (adenine(1518)-N(6)/adenine(1519)-N(6))-dimethyltransferase RsmA [Thalassoroseus pseudoceratinae]